LVRDCSAVDSLLGGNYFRRGFTLALTATVISVVTQLDQALGQEPLPTPIPSTETSDVDAAAPLPPPETAPSQLPATVIEQAPIVETNGHAVAETPRRFHYQFSVVVREVYDDNININQIDRRSDFYTSLEPRIELSLGDTEGEGYNSLRFIYSPSAVFYIDNSDADAIQHVIHLEGQRVFGKLTASLSTDVAFLNGTDLRSLSDTTGRQANVDVGTRTQENIYTTRVAASYDLSPKTFLSAGADYTRSDYASFVSSQTASANFFLNYNYSPKLVVGMGPTVGYNDTDGSTPAQSFEQVNLRVNYNPGEKLNFFGSAGFEFRQFGGDSSGTRISPVYELNAVYQPFDATSISIEGARRTQSSASIANSDFVSTDIHFTAQQRFFQRMFVNLSTGFLNSQYFSAVNGVDVNRSDDYYYFQVAFDFNITRFWNAGFYYLHRQDASSVDTFSFNDNQIGFRTSLTF